MEYSNKELYKISKTVFREATLHQQIESAGSNKAKFLEKIGKQKKANFESQSIAMKVLIAIYICVFTIIPIFSFIQINFVTKELSIDTIWVNLVGGLSLSSFMLLEPIILIIFTVTFTWGFLSNEPYTWVSTLPFSRKDISKISFFTFLRGIDVHFIVLFLVLPIGTMIGINLPKMYAVGLGTNFLMFFVSLLINLSYTIFNISIVILLGRKMAKIMENQEENNKLANFFRITTILAYLLFTMLASYGIQTIINYLPNLFIASNQFISSQTADIINKILCFIPFPFSGGYLLSSIAIGVTNVPLLILVGSIVGSVLQIGLAFLLFRKALRTLQDVASLEPKLKEKKASKKPIVIQVRTMKPTVAYLKRDLALITRELQTLTFMLLPIMIPISTALAFALDMMVGNTGIHAMVLYITTFAFFSTFFILMGVTSIESGGETITASLPINIRDQIKAKIPFLFSSVPLMTILAVILQIKKAAFIDILIMTSVQLPAIFIVAMVGLLVKILLFGKFKHKYVIEEVNTTNKTIKYIGILLLMFILGAGFLSLLLVNWWLPLVVEGVCLLVLMLVYNLLFPKKEINAIKISI
ncbi:MAG: hypothetical protein ACFFDW_17175 [Candidatus Thorarchaeota archaeon]